MFFFLSILLLLLFPTDINFRWNWHFWHLFSLSFSLCLRLFPESFSYFIHVEWTFKCMKFSVCFGSVENVCVLHYITNEPKKLNISSLKTTQSFFFHSVGCCWAVDVILIQVFKRSNMLQKTSLKSYKSIFWALKKNYFSFKFNR